MAEVIIKMFGNSTRVLVKDGEFNDVEGEYQHFDFSQHITNRGCHNIMGNILYNVGNTCPQVIYHGGARSMHYATSALVATGGAGAIDNHAPSPSRSQVLNSSFPRSLAQYICAQPGDIRQMSAGESAFMENQMAEMMQEMDSECGDDEEQIAVGPEMYDDDDTSDEEMSSTTWSQSLSANFNRLTIEERVYSSPRSRSAFIHGSSSTADESSRHIFISGNHTEVDDSYHQFNFNSNRVENNIVENSFGGGRLENIS
jgi:hypothetical protein